jgi:adenine/guanine phosphoribosyltransferase-like PRPP-binding protein
MDLRSYVRDVPDFPRPGIVFKDITPLLLDPAASRAALDGLELHADAIAEGDAVLVHDDLIATGGTAAATVQAVESLGGRVAACSFLVELAFLGGRRRLGELPVDALISYDA